MEKKQKIDWSGILITALLILLFCFGGFMFAISVGSDDVAELFVFIAAIIGAFFLFAMFLPKLVIPLFYVLLISGLLYAFGGMPLFLNGVGFVIGVPILVLVVWGIYKIGDRFGWWELSDWNKYK